MSFTPYLYFDGLAEDALRFYAHVFRTEEPRIMRYSDAPPTAGMAPSDHVLYGHIMLGDQALMASDVAPGTEYRPQQSVAVHHEVADYDEGKRIMHELAVGGDVGMPFGPTFFSPGFGTVRDRFGTHWMIGLPAE